MILLTMAVNRSETDCMPLDYYYAKKIGKALYDSKYAGIDIKTQVTVQNGDAIKVIVAIPMNRTHNKEVILEIVKEAIGFDIDDNLIVINGTGTFIKHGAIADCGVTGRKLAVDFYGGNCNIGGGSPWAKDGTKADVSLNILAREIALSKMNEKMLDVSYCAMNCFIGSDEVLVTVKDGNNNVIKNEVEIIKPKDVIDKYKLNTPIFADFCRNGIFDKIQA